MAEKKLAERQCVPCKGGEAPLKGDVLKPLLQELDNDWRVVDEHHLAKTFKFKDFKQALAFTNRVGELAEAVGHHPDVLLSWAKVELKVWTHKIKGLSEADFVFAAKVETL